jgi:parvulin-like peptidyl-prolyl isomerase
VKSAVASAWKKEQTATKLAEIAKDVALAMKESKTPANVLKERGIATRSSGPVKRNTQKTASGVALTPQVVAAIFATAPGKSTSAFESDGEDFIIAVVKSRKVPGAESAKALAKDADYKTMHDRMEQNARNDMVQSYLNSLRSKYSVVINEDVLNAYAERE